MLRLVLLLTVACAAGDAQSFEVASVKPAAAAEGARPGMRGGPGTSDPGQITFTSVPLSTVLLRAYGLETFQLTATDWMSSRR